MQRNITRIGFSLLLLICSFFVSVEGQADTRSGSQVQVSADIQTLEEGFKDPPKYAMPRTWWHWTGGNVTLDGITKDLEWMKRVGIAGFQLADVTFGFGQSVDQKLMFGSDEWLDAVLHAARKADSLDLEMSIFSSAGWSLAGGPWVKPAQAMKKFVWSTTVVDGPSVFNGKLTDPPSNNGPIRNFAPGRRRNTDPVFYGDAALLAFPLPEDEQVTPAREPEYSDGRGEKIIAGVLTDDDLNSGLVLHAASGTIRLMMDFGESFTARALSITVPGGIPTGRLLAGDDLQNLSEVLVLPGAQNYRGGRVRTFALPSVRARYYCMEVTGAPRSPAEFITQPEPPRIDSLYLTEFIIHPGGRVNRWEDKAGFSLLNDYSTSASPEQDEGSLIPVRQVMDISSAMGEEGSVNWKVPEGKWMLLRTGYSLTGAKNRPAMAGGLGYEVDKLNGDYVRNYLDGYLDPIRTKLGPEYGHTLQYLMLDSWEAGTQNWTDDMISEFARRRGYGLVPYLPALAGYIVGSTKISDAFLWDFRRTLADMFAENFYGTVSGYLHGEGLGVYGEASGVSLEILEDALLSKKYMDIPMGEFWVNDLHPSPAYYVDVRGAASAAHVYGKKIVATESFTGGNYESPARLKSIADYWFTQGVNRLVFHTSAHQPLDTKPGNVMVGTHLNRNITWAEQAGPFMEYLARTSYMLQQGEFVADLAYLLAEGAPSTMPFWGTGVRPPVPPGYDYDFMNTDVLLNLVSVDTSGMLQLPGGMSYSVLVLPETGFMTARVLEKIFDLVNAGATVLGPRPDESPSLADMKVSNQRYCEMSKMLWGALDGVTRTRNHCGKGMIVWGEPPEQVLEMMNISPDVEYAGGLDSELSWIHRRTSDADIYFISSRDSDPANFDIRFRVDGPLPELWDPLSGKRVQVPYTCRDGLTTVPVELAGYGSVFVVFSAAGSQEEPASHGSAARGNPAMDYFPRKENLTEQFTLSGPWEVRFPENLGAPDTIVLQRLQSWTEHENTGVKYFSGTATYSCTFKVPSSWLDMDLLLDLGRVGDLGMVSLNGNEIGMVWTEPYILKIGKELKKGMNRIDIRVTNEWTNRIIGDMDLPDEEKILNTAVRIFFAEPVLQDSGLMGPVKIYSVGSKSPRGK